MSEPVRILGHGGICDTMRQGLSAAGACASTVRRDDPETHELLMRSLLKIESQVDLLENRSGELSVTDHVLTALRWNGVEPTPEFLAALEALSGQDAAGA